MTRSESINIAVICSRPPPHASVRTERITFDVKDIAQSKIFSAAGVAFFLILDSTKPKSQAPIEKKSKINTGRRLLRNIFMVVLPP